MNTHFNSSRLQDPSQFHELFTYSQGHCRYSAQTSTAFIPQSRKGNGQGMTQERDTYPPHHGHISGLQHLVPLPVLSGTMLLLWPRTSGSMTIPRKSMIRSYSSFFLITVSQLSLSEHNRPSVNVAEVHCSISPIFIWMDCTDWSSTSKSFIHLV